MYRRLKNLLGVSLIIFAILLSQIPMPQVQADNADNAENFTVTFQYGLSNLNPSVEKVIVAKGNTLGIDAITIKTDEHDSTELKEGETYTLDGVAYKFNGWRTSSETGSKWNITDSTVDEDTELYATWERLDGEQFSYDEVMEEAANQIATAANTTKPVTVTYNFGFPMSYFASGSLPSGTKDVSGIATLEVTQEVNIETGSQINTTEIQKFLSGANCTLTVDGATISASLYNWQTVDNYIWDFQKPITNDITLYANWNLGTNQCTITYLAADAQKYSEQTKLVKIGSTLPQPDNTPIRSGYSFTKWYLDTSASTEVDWSQKVAKNMTLYAGWSQNEYTITLDLNGGIYTADSKEKIELAASDGQKLSEIVTVDKTQISYAGYETDDTWYQDQECFTAYDMNVEIKGNMTLYKKWYKTDSKGFELSPDGKYLYRYTGNTNSTDKLEVKIPDTVTMIGPTAFSDMSNIRSITLPSAISTIAGDAFCGMNTLTGTVYLLAADTTNDSVSYQKAQDLIKKYKNFCFVSYLKPETPVFNVNSSSFASNTATGQNNVSSYVKIAASGLEPDNYYVKLSPNPQTNALKEYFAKEDQQKVYYLEISMTKGISGTPTYEDTMNYIITFPLPDIWQNSDITKENLKVYSRNYTTNELEELTVDAISNDNGVKCVRFETWHFSPFVLAFNGTIINDNNNNENNNNGNNNQNGGGNSGGGSDSGNSGGSDSGSSGSGSSSSGGSGSTTSSTTSSTTGTTASTVTSDLTQLSTQTGSDENTQAGGTSSSNTGKATGHVKDATPKTGDPLEYKTLLVCGLFSMGVLMILIGNKKKPSSFSQYRRA